MSVTSASSDDLKAELSARGYVVLREKSYRQAQERQRVAEALMRDAFDQRDSQQAWVERELGPEIRRLRDRVTFLYGAARAHGATVDDLGCGFKS